jgi:hypothetical protein
MTFLEWLHMEYLEPEPGDNYHEKDMVAAWNQAIAVCRQVVKKNFETSDEQTRKELYEIYNQLDNEYWRGENNGH